MAVALLAIVGIVGAGSATANPETLGTSYSFDAGSGTTVEDLTGHGHVGLIEGPEWTEGIDGGALSFDGGAEDCVSIPDGAGLELNENFTFEGWIRPERNDRSGPIFVKEDAGDVKDSLYLGLAEVGHLEGLLEPRGGGYVGVEDPSETPQNEWTFVALTYNGNEAVLYVDGSAVSRDLLSNIAPAKGPIRIGCSPTFGEGFTGKIDDVRMYTSALSESAVQVDMESRTEPGSIHLLVLGSLAEVPEGGLIGVQQGIRVEASGSREGSIEALEMKIDGTVSQSVTRAQALEEGGSESCSEDICTLEYVVEPLFVGELDSGPHRVTITAVGDAGSETSYTKEVHVDASLPTLGLGGRLYEDRGQLSEESEGITVSAEDGEGPGASGVKSVSLYIGGEYVEGTQEPCEGGCPAEIKTSYRYSQGVWGSGPQEMTIVAVDGAGNEISKKIDIDQSFASVEPECDSPSREIYEDEEPEPTSAATTAIEEFLPAAVSPSTEGTGEFAEFVPTFEKGTSRLEEGSAFLARGGAVGGRTNTDEAMFTVGQGSCLSPLQGTSAESSAALLPGSGAIAYTDTARETDTFVRDNGLGSTIAESFRGPSAPRTLSWRVALEGDQELEELADGGIAVVAPDGQDLSELGSPEGSEGLASPADIADTDAVLEAAEYDLVTTNEEVEGEVLAVLPPPMAVGPGGSEMEGGTISIGPGGNTVVAEVPPASKAMVLRTVASPDVAALCASAFEESPDLYSEGCGEEGTDGDGRPYITGMDWALNGSFVYSVIWDESETGPGEMPGPAEVTLYRSDPDGSDVETLETPGFEVRGGPKVSPDGTHLAFHGCSLTTLDCGVVVTNEDGGDGRLVATIPSVCNQGNPGFNSDGERVIYPSCRIEEGPEEVEYVYEELFSVSLSGGPERRLTSFVGGARVNENGYLVQGTSTSGAPAADPAGGVLTIEDGAGVYTIPEGEYIERNQEEFVSLGVEPAYNPTGTKIVVSKEFQEGRGTPDLTRDDGALLKTGTATPSGIYVENPDGSEQTLVAQTGDLGELRGRMPVFSPDGSEVAYIENGVIYTVPTSGGSPKLAVSGASSGVTTLADALEGASPQIREIGSNLENVVLESSASAVAGGIVPELEAVLKEVTLAQADFCVHHWPECHSFWRDRHTALQARALLFTQGRHFDTSTMGNAFQHGFWTTLMVRDSSREEDDLPSGLWFAGALEKHPYSWDSRQDLLNDMVGYVWFLGEGIESHEDPDGTVEFRRRDKLEDCSALLVKGKNARFIGGRIDPFAWAGGELRKDDWELMRLIYRKYRGDKGTGPRIWPTGKTCPQIWPEVEH